jgi:hypothetical protein
MDCRDHVKDSFPNPALVLFWPFLGHFNQDTTFNTNLAGLLQCDEQKPECGNCIKHSTRCDFTAVSSASNFTTLNANSNPNGGRRHESDTPGTSGGSSASHHHTPTNQSTPPSLPLNMEDLELLHNFSTSTCYTITRVPEIRNIWRISVPQLAFSHDFVMHAILALSALHLARYRPDKVDFHVSQAVSHYQAALGVATSILLHVNEENCSALHIFSSVTCIIALASPQKPGNFFLVGEQGVAEWLLLVRGVRSIIDSSHEWLYNGILGPMFKIPERMHRRRVANGDDSPSENEHLLELRQLIRGTVTDHKTLQIYNQTVEELAVSFSLVYNIGPEITGTSETFRWILRISQEYLHLLNQGEGEAFVILAYFCVLLKQMDCFWWMEGWSIHLISGIYDSLDEEHRLWLRWPMEEIGWVPS